VSDLISIEVQDRFKKIEAKYGEISSLNGCDPDDEEDLRVQLVGELAIDILTLEIEPHQLLLFREAMDAAFDSVFETMNILASPDH
jgi:hypothetical protein